MIATGAPDPFPAAVGFSINATGGVPPYTYRPDPSPPNPPGVSVSSDGFVTVPDTTPPGTPITVTVEDSAIPPSSVPVVCRTA